MTAPQQPIPDVEGFVAPYAEDPSGTPSVLVKFKTGGAEVTFRLDATKAPLFMANLAQGVMNAAQASLAAAGPRLVTPTSPLIVPGHVNGTHRS